MTALEKIIPPGESCLLAEPWTVFGPIDHRSARLPPEMLQVPDTLVVDGATLQARCMTPIRSQLDLAPLLGPAPTAVGRSAIVCVNIQASSPTSATIGIGADHWFQAWLDGYPLFEGREIADKQFPPSPTAHCQNVTLAAGRHLLVIRFTSGRGSSVLTVAGPGELRDGDFRSIIDDPVLVDPRWARPDLRAAIGSKSMVDIGSWRELFIDDFLIDTLSGAAERRLHHPVPREVAMTFDQPWEGNFSGNFLPVSVMSVEGRCRMYYYAANPPSGVEPSGLNHSDRQRLGFATATCVAESNDGIHFTRLIQPPDPATASVPNNIVWRGMEYFTPFLDGNPKVPDDQRFKAICNHPQGGLGAYVSADGLRWRPLVDHPVITVGAFDSQNLAFFDPLRSCYVEYHRGQLSDQLERGIMTSTSKDFVHWTEPRPLQFEDVRREHMYTNCVRPYPRAPHLYIGTPARFVPTRKKVASHGDHGISDAILMCSRDGLRFQRWEEAFIRPDLDPESWTDRNNYPAWGMYQSSPSEISIYWCERNGYPQPRLRRGTLRTDGFASIHAGGDDCGEMLTRPLMFNGSRLELNYATSCRGAILVELCHLDGRSIDGFSLADSNPLFGNELSATALWRSRIADVSPLAGMPVRLRIRMHDADLYAVRFVSPAQKPA